MRDNYFLMTLVFTFLSIFGSVGSLASTPLPSVVQVIHYQAHLSDADGLNYDGDVAVQVRIYDSVDLGIPEDMDSENLLYAEEHPKITVRRGELKISIGEGKAIGRFDGLTIPFEKIALAENVYVELWIDGDRIVPRQRADFAGSAIRAEYGKKALELIDKLNITTSDLPNLSASKITGVLSAERLPEQISSSFISGVLSSDRIPSDIPLSKLTSGYLNSSTLPDLSASSVTQGTFSDGMISSNMLRTSDLKIDSTLIWPIDDNELIPIPSGFTSSQCSWILAPAETVTEGKINGIDYGFDNMAVFTWRGMSGYEPPKARCNLSKWENVSCPVEGQPGRMCKQHVSVSCKMYYILICKK